MTDTKTEQLPARLTKKQIEQRIKLNQSLRFGLESATPAQLNMIYILSQRWNLDPVTDLTLYQGVPWVKDAGWFRIIRRHEHFRGIDTRPLSKDEKELWGYPLDDVVIECAITTDDHGVIKGRGRATRTEIDLSRTRSRDSGKQASPIGVWDVEIAEKRAIARTAKLAFGQDVPDEADIQREIEEEMTRRNDPQTVQTNAQRYTEIYEGAYDIPERPPADRPALPEVVEGEVVEQPRAPDWHRNRALAAEAYNLGIRLADLPGNASVDDVDARNAELEAKIQEATGEPVAF